MFDLEHQVHAEGFPEGYSFDQTESTLIVCFPIPEGTEADDIECEVDIQHQSVYAGLAGKEPVVCGKFYQPVKSYTTSLTHTEFRIEIVKDSPGMWKMLISSESERGVDAKSLYIFGLNEDFSGHPREAFAWIKKAADRNYKVAKIHLVSVYLDEFNAYDIKANPEEAIRILETFPQKEMNERHSILLATALIQTERYDEAVSVLEPIKDKNDETKMMLAALYSPYSGNHGKNPKEAVRLLEQLVDNQNPQAMYLLSVHLIHGSGIESDKKRAKELYNDALNYNKDFPPIDFDDYSWVAYTAIGVAAFSALALGYLIVRRRK